MTGPRVTALGAARMTVATVLMLIALPTAARAAESCSGVTQESPAINGRQVIFHGAAPAGTTLEVEVDKEDASPTSAGGWNRLGSFRAVADASGAWATESQTYADGRYRTRLRNGRLICAYGGFTIDELPPTVSIIGPAQDEVVDTRTPLIWGKAGTEATDLDEVLLRIFRLDGSNRTLFHEQKAPVNRQEGEWGMPTSAALADGTYEADALQSQQNGVTGTSGPRRFSVKAVDGPKIVRPGPGERYDYRTPTFSGTAMMGPETGDVVKVLIIRGDALVEQRLALRSPDGTWSTTVTEQLDYGVYQLEALQEVAGRDLSSGRVDFTVAGGSYLQQPNAIANRMPDLLPGNYPNYTVQEAEGRLIVAGACFLEPCWDRSRVELEARAEPRAEVPKGWRNKIQPGQVFSQSPAPETRLFDGTEVTVHYYEPTLDEKDPSCLDLLSMSKSEIDRRLGGSFEAAEELLERLKCPWKVNLGVGPVSAPTVEQAKVTTGDDAYGRKFKLLSVDGTQPSPLSQQPPADRPGKDCELMAAGKETQDARIIGGLKDNVVKDLNELGCAWRITAEVQDESVRAPVDSRVKSYVLKTDNDASGREYALTIAVPPFVPRPVQGAAPEGTSADGECEKEITIGPVRATASKCFRQQGLTWVSRATVNVNGLDLVPHDAGTSIVLDPLNLEIRGKGKIAVQVRVPKPLTSPLTLYSGEFDWSFRPPGLNGPLPLAQATIGGLGAVLKTRIPLPQLPKHGLPELRLAPPAGTKLAGLALGGSIGAAFKHDESKPVQDRSAYTVTLWANAFLQVGDGKVAGNFEAEATEATGLSVEELQFELEDVRLFAFDVTGRFHYFPAGDRWFGGVRIEIPTPPGVLRQYLEAEAELIQGEITFLRGEVGGINWPTFVPGVFLDFVGLKYWKEPLGFRGVLGMYAGPIIVRDPALRIKGALSVFVNPLKFRVEGEAKLPGDIKLFSAEVNYDLGSGSVDVQGGLNFRWPAHRDPGKEDIAANLKLAGWFHGGNFTLTASGMVKVFAVQVAGDVLVSSKGIAVCGQVPLIGKAGIGVGWSGNVEIGACQLEKFASVKGSAAAPKSVSLPPGLPQVGFKIKGRGDAPLVTLTGPKGQRFTTPADQLASLSGRFAVQRSPESDTTYVLVGEPAGGRWSIGEAPGSTPIVSIQTAEGIGPVGVRGKIGGKGGSRALSYIIRNARGRTVRFIEEAKGGINAEIGRAKRVRGTLRFKPADGKAKKRTIVALVEQGGFGIQRIKVTSYKAPKPVRPAAPARIKLVRVVDGPVPVLNLTWPSAKLAKRYEVTVKLGDGSALRFITFKPALTVPRVSWAQSATVTVRGLDAKEQPGATRSAKVAAGRAKN